jgi:hypothetical protein
MGTMEDPKKKVKVQIRGVWIKGQAEERRRWPA